MNFPAPLLSVEECNIVIDNEFKPVWRPELQSEEYHSDKTAVNSSSLKTILRSPFAFKRNFIDGLTKEPTESMKFGTLAHLAILEGDKFREKYVVMPEFESFDLKGNKSESKNTTYYKNQVSEWKKTIPDDAIIVKQEERDKLFFMIDSVLENEAAVSILKNGLTEISGYYSDPETGIVCRIRPDFVSFDVNAKVDVKTVSKCDVDWFRRNRVEDKEFMYHFQMSMYNEGVSIISGKRLDYCAWLLVANEPPYDCVLVPVEVVYLDIGLKLYRTALNKLKNSITTKTWERQKSIQEMHPSHYFLQEQGIE